MISLITVARHGYLAQQIVQMFITIKNFCLRFINIVSTSTLLNVSIQSRTFSSDLTLKIFLQHEKMTIYRPYLGFGG